MDIAFLAAQYKWILIAFILVVMLIIGYIADTTDFGHKKPVKKKKEKPIKNPNEVEEFKVDDIARNEKIIGNDEDLNVPFGDTIKLPKIDEEVAMPIEEDLTKPLEDVTPIVDEKPIEEVVLDEDLTKPLEEVKEIDGTPATEIALEKEDDKAEEVVTSKEVKKIDTPKKGKKSKEKVVPEFIADQYNPNGEVSSDDDIWNF